MKIIFYYKLFILQCKMQKIVVTFRNERKLFTSLQQHIIAAYLASQSLNCPLTFNLHKQQSMLHVRVVGKCRLVTQPEPSMILSKPHQTCCVIPVPSLRT